MIILLVLVGIYGSMKYYEFCCRYYASKEFMILYTKYTAIKSARSVQYFVTTNKSRSWWDLQKEQLWCLHIACNRDVIKTLIMLGAYGVSCYNEQLNTMSVKCKNFLYSLKV